GSSSISELCRYLCQLAQRSEGRPDLFGEQPRLFPCRKVPAPVDLVEVGQVSIGAPGPALRGSIDVVRKDRDADGQGDLGRLDRRCTRRAGSAVLPLQAPRRGGGV